MMIDGSVLTVVMVLEAGRARIAVRGYRRLLTPLSDENRPMSMRCLDVDAAKPVVMATDDVTPVVAMDDESRSPSTICPTAVDDAKPVVMKTPASRARLSVRGHRLLVMELNFASRLMSTECPHVDAVEPVVMDDESRQTKVDGSRLVVVGLTTASRAQTLVRGHRRLLVAETNDGSRLTTTKPPPPFDAAKPAVTVVELLLVDDGIATSVTIAELLLADDVAAMVETATDGSEPAVRRRTVPRRLLR